MLSLIFGLLTASGAEGVRTEPLFLSIANGQVLVRTHDRRTFGLAVCPVPAGPFPDLSFAGPGALDGCAALEVALPDDAVTRARLADEFERVVTEYGARPMAHGRIFGRAALVAAGYAAVNMAASTAVTMQILRGRGPAVYRRLLGFAGAMSSVLGAVVFTDQVKLERGVELERRGLAQLPTAGVGTSVNTPAILRVSPRTFDTVQRLAARALANVAANAAQP